MDTTTSSVPGRTGVQKIIEALDTNEALPAMAVTVGRLVSLAHSDAEAVAALSRVITMDVSLTQKILGVANSSLYGHSGVVESISRAIMIIGFNAVRSMALSMSILDNLQDPRQKQTLQDEMGQALLACTLARRLAETGSAHTKEMAEVATMLKSLSRLIAAAYAFSEMTELNHVSVARGIPRKDLAREILGASFEEINDTVLSRMDLPLDLVNATRDGAGENAVVARISEHAMGLAECLMSGGLTLADRRVGRAIDDLAEAFDIGKDRVVFVAQASMEEFDGACAALRLQVRARTRPKAAPDSDLNDGSDSSRAATLQLLEVKSALNSLTADRAPAIRVIDRMMKGVMSTMAYRNMLFAQHVSGDSYRVRRALGTCTRLADENARLKLGSAPTLLDAAASRGVSIHLRDLADPKLRGRLPAWLQTDLSGARSLLLMPLRTPEVNIGFLYCDRGVSEVESLGGEMAALSEMRNQVVLAFSSNGLG